MLLRGRMDVRVRGPPIVRWMAPKDRLEPGNDLRHRLGLFWSTGVLLRQPDVFSFQSRCDASALTIRGRRCDCCVLRKLGWTRRRARDWIKARPEMPGGNPSLGIRPWARNRSPFTPPAKSVSRTMRKLELTLACGRYDRTQPLLDGRVQPEGVDLTFLPLRPGETFWRMLNHGEFDASEMSLSSYTILRSEGDTSPSRSFRRGFSAILLSTCAPTPILSGRRT